MTTFDIAMIVCAIGLPIAVGYIAFAAIGNIRMDRRNLIADIAAHDVRNRAKAELAAALATVDEFQKETAT